MTIKVGDWIELEEDHYEDFRAPFLVIGEYAHAGRRVLEIDNGSGVYPEGWKVVTPDPEHIEELEERMDEPDPLRLKDSIRRALDVNKKRKRKITPGPVTITLTRKEAKALSRVASAANGLASVHSKIAKEMKR